MENTLTKKSGDKTTGRLITGMFSDRDSAEPAYDSLNQDEYNKNDMNLIMSDDMREKKFADQKTELGRKAMEGAGKGGAIGGTIGAMTGVIAALGTNLVIPGFGLIIAGPIAAGLACAGAGSLTGGIIGALATAGTAKDHGKAYKSGIKKGDNVIKVDHRNDKDSKFHENYWRMSQAEEIYK